MHSQKKTVVAVPLQDVTMGLLAYSECFLALLWGCRVFWVVVRFLSTSPATNLYHILTRFFTRLWPVLVFNALEFIPSVESYSKILRILTLIIVAYFFMCIDMKVKLRETKAERFCLPFQRPAYKSDHNKWACVGCLSDCVCEGLSTPEKVDTRMLLTRYFEQFQI